MRQNSYDSSAEWEKVIGQEKTTNYSYGVEKKASIFGNKIISTGNGNMHETMQSKYTYTDIQNLETGQSIFISKDQKIDKKMKMRYVKVDGLVLENKESTKINLDKTAPIKHVNPDDIKPNKYKESEETEETNFDDIDNLLK